MFELIVILACVGFLLFTDAGHVTLWLAVNVSLMLLGLAVAIGFWAVIVLSIVAVIT